MPRSSQLPGRQDGGHCPGCGNYHPAPVGDPCPRAERPLTEAEFDALPDAEKLARLTKTLRAIEPWTWRDEVRHWLREVAAFARRLISEDARRTWGDRIACACFWIVVVCCAIYLIGTYAGLRP